MQDLRICFVGDSYLNGTGDPEGLGRVRRLCRERYSPTQRFTHYGLGVRGHTTADIKARSEAEYMAGLPLGDRMHCDGRGYEIMTEHIQAWPCWDAWFPPAAKP